MPMLDQVREIPIATSPYILARTSALVMSSTMAELRCRREVTECFTDVILDFTGVHSDYAVATT
jgi:hypothetical protein